MNKVSSIISKFSTIKLDELVRIIFYGDKNFDNDSGLRILTATIKFMKQIQRFERALF